MDRVSPPMNHSRRQLAVGAWSLLVVCLGLDLSRLSLWVSPGVVLLVSMISSCALLLIQESGVSKAALSRWKAYAPGMIALLIPFAWSMILCNWRSPFHCVVLILTALAPVGIMLLLGSQAQFRPIENWNEQQSDCGRCPIHVQTNETFASSTEEREAFEEEEFEEGVEESVSTVRLAEFRDEATTKTPICSESPASDVIQWLTRSQTVEGEIIEGGFRIDFDGGQRDATIHVSFCPPFSQTPKITTCDLDEANLEIHVAAGFPFGARLTVRRFGMSKSSEEQNPIFSCRIGFVAFALPLKKAA